MVAKITRRTLYWVTATGKVLTMFCEMLIRLILTIRRP